MVPAPARAWQSLLQRPLALRFSGELNTPALERALREVVRRHEVLRTTFEAVDGTPLQFVHDEVTLRLPVLDFRNRRDDALALRAALDAEARRPFNLAPGRCCGRPSSASTRPSTCSC